MRKLASHLRYNFPEIRSETWGLWSLRLGKAFLFLLAFSRVLVILVGIWAWSSPLSVDRAPVFSFFTCVPNWLDFRFFWHSKKGSMERKLFCTMHVGMRDRRFRFVLLFCYEES